MIHCFLRFDKSRNLTRYLFSIAFQCERIHQTAVPLNYARHALRCVSLWLLTLPLALVKDFGLVTAPVIMCLVSLRIVIFH